MSLHSLLELASKGADLMGVGFQGHLEHLPCCAPAELGEQRMEVVVPQTNLQLPWHRHGLWGLCERHELHH